MHTDTHIHSYIYMAHWVYVASDMTIDEWVNDYYPVAFMANLNAITQMHKYIIYNNTKPQLAATAIAFTLWPSVKTLWASNRFTQYLFDLI